MTPEYEKLKALLKEIKLLNETARILNWDRATHMPQKGGEERGDQLAVLSRIIHEKSTSDELGKLLDAVKDLETELPYDSVDAANIRLARREYDKAVRVPVSFAQKLAEDGSRSFMAWTKARPANNFEMVRPHLETAIENSLAYSEFFAPYDHIFDPHINNSNYGLTTADVRPLFDALRAATVELLEKIRAQPQVDSSCIYGDFPKEKQYEFARKVVADMGYDFERGRLDETYHPFAIPLGPDDVRITTRGNDGHLGDAVFATIHEAGHGMHGQGRNREVLPFSFSGAGVAESQSRLWENRIARSRDFWHIYYADLQALFPQLKSVDVETFYKAINKVQGSLIRVQADELTYNLHIMIRTALEMDLIEGKLAVKDLPEAWNALYESDLAIRPHDDKDGVLQDTHWYRGIIGGSFVGYTLGNILTAQYYDAALKAQPQIEEEVRQGRYQTLFNWLHEHIWRPSSMFTTHELNERILGGGMDVQPLVDYLNAKFGDIYGV